MRPCIPMQADATSRRPGARARTTHGTGLASLASGLLLLVGCGGSAYTGWEPLKLAELPDAKAIPSRSWVILDEETRVDFDLDPSTGEPYALETAFRRTRILRAAGRKRARVSIEHHPALYSVQALDVRLVSPPAKKGDPDEVKTWTRADAADLPQVSWSLYHDTRVLGITAAPAPVGSVVEQRSVKRYSDLRVFAPSHFFPREEAVRRSAFVVSAPTGWRVEHLVRKFGEPLEWKPAIADADGRTVLAWRVDHTTTGVDDEDAPDALQVLVRLGAWVRDGRLVENLSDHRAVSAYHHNLQKERATPDEALRARVSEILSGAPDDPFEKARRLYDWVRQRVRYCQVYFGMDGWIPHDAAQVHALGYGDCKDKANLLQTMLAIAGIPSRVGSLYSHEGIPRRYGLPVLAGNANHVILVVDLPGGPVFADPTDRSVPFGRLPFRDQGADLLPVSDPGSDLMKTPESQPTDNVARVELSGTMTPDGRWTADFSASFWGAFADEVRARLVQLPEQARRDDLPEWVNLVDARVDLLQSVENLEPVDAATPLNTRGRMSGGQALAFAGDRRLLRFSDVAERVVPVLRARKRSAPIVLGFRRRHEHVFSWTLPAGWSVEVLPQRQLLESPYGRLELEWSREGDRVNVSRRLDLQQTLVPAAEHDALRQFLDGVTRAERVPVVLKIAEGER